MTVEDYGEDHYASAPDRAPGISSGKFVHITGPDGEYLILSPVALTQYHAQIVERFCQRHEVATCVMSASRDDAHFDQPGWSVCGGGRFRLDRADKTLALWDHSKAYGRFDGMHIQKALQDTPPWSEFAIRADDNR